MIWKLVDNKDIALLGFFRRGEISWIIGEKGGTFNEMGLSGPFNGIQSNLGKTYENNIRALRKSWQVGDTILRIC